MGRRNGSGYNAQRERKRRTRMLKLGRGQSGSVSKSQELPVRVDILFPGSGRRVCRGLLPEGVGWV